jgi:drug/metabolite transporter (DMT)-like permease
MVWKRKGTLYPGYRQDQRSAGAPDPRNKSGDDEEAALLALASLSPPSLEYPSFVVAAPVPAIQFRSPVRTGRQEPKSQLATRPALSDKRGLLPTHRRRSPTLRRLTHPDLPPAMPFELWIPVTIAAAFFQNLRSALQKHLKGRLSTSGASYVRFFYALPLAALYVAGLNTIGGLPLPRPNLTFLAYCLLGGLTQILFTVFLLWTFSFRNFAVGTTFSKLEVVMVAVLGAVILGDHLNWVAILAIAVSACGLIALSLGQAKLSLRALIAGLGEKSTLLGLVSAAFLGASSVFYRGGSLSLHHDSVVMSAAFTLVVSLTLQTLIMGAWIAWKEPGEFRNVLANWRTAGAVGVAGMLASVCWFTAFTVQDAAHVRALGQIELVFTFLATTLFFHEKVDIRELIGILLVAGGIVLLVLGG